MPNAYRAYYPDDTFQVSARLYETPLLFSGLAFEAAIERLPERAALQPLSLDAKAGRFEYLTADRRRLVVLRER